MLGNSSGTGGLPRLASIRGTAGHAMLSMGLEEPWRWKELLQYTIVNTFIRVLLSLGPSNWVDVGCVVRTSLGVEQHVASLPG